MTRRTFILVAAAGPALAVFARTLPVPAQSPDRVYRVGYLSPRSGIGSREEALRRGLRELGYVEGQNLVMEWRFTRGQSGLSPRLAAELIQLKLDCIIVVGAGPAAALHRATRTIPIVIGNIDADPVQMGLVASLARPGGNVTGLTGMAYETAGKRLELLKEIVPRLSRVAILVDGNARDARDAHVVASEAAARGLRLQLQVVEVGSPDDLPNAFRALRQGRAEALSVVGIGLINSHRARIVELVRDAKLPTIYSIADFVIEGGLVSYTADADALSGRAAGYVDRILKGAKPADLPVQQPTKFELVINLKAATQLGVTIPPAVLLRADRVIE